MTDVRVLIGSLEDADLLRNSPDAVGLSISRTAGVFLMGKYRKKPVVVEAVRITGEWFDGEYPNPLHVEGVLVEGVLVDFLARHVEFTTIHGQATVAEVGDWLIREPDGVHWHSCKPDIFEATYDPVEVDDSPSREYWEVVYCSTGTPVPPIDENPGSKDKGGLVYSSRDAAECACKHQRNMFGLRCEPRRIF